ncbi:MAG: peptide deformylase [Planctomycetota bacterium]
MHVVPHPHPALRVKAEPVRAIDKNLRRVVDQMRVLMYATRGIGLAANQVGLPWRLFLTNPTGDSDRPEEERVFVNPVVLKRNGAGEDEEGCLSLPDLFGPVRRAERVTVEAYDLKGQSFRLELDGLDARVVLHENDHLDGVLFPDRMRPEEREKIAPGLAELEAKFRAGQAAGEIPPDEELERTTAGLADGSLPLSVLGEVELPPPEKEPEDGAET